MSWLPKTWWTRAALAIVVISLAGWFLRVPLLNECLDYLTAGETPIKADLGVVLAGDGAGLRILKGAELVRDGFVPTVLVSGPNGSYDTPECDLAIRFAVAHGYPESYFQHWHANGRTTQEESFDVIAELMKRQVRSVLVVTSGFHTRRAGLYYKDIPGIEARMIASPDRYAERGVWWRDREGRKTVFSEWLKTIATWFGI